MFKAMDHIVMTDDSRYDYVVPGENLYPNMIKEIRETIADGPEQARAKLKAQGIVLEKSPIARDYLRVATRVPTYAWDLALEAPHDGLSQEEQAARKEALECARLWFTELLHREHTKKIMASGAYDGDVDNDSIADVQGAGGAPMRIRIEPAPGNIYRWKMHAPVRQ